MRPQGQYEPDVDYAGRQFRHMWESGPADVRPSRGGGPKDLLSVVAVAVAVLLGAEYFGYSPAELWDWGRAAVNDWLDP